MICLWTRGSNKCFPSYLGTYESYPFLMMGVFDDFRLLGERENQERKKKNTRLEREREEKVLASRSFNKALKC